MSYGSPPPFMDSPRHRDGLRAPPPDRRYASDGWDDDDREPRVHKRSKDKRKPSRSRSRSRRHRSRSRDRRYRSRSRSLSRSRSRPRDRSHKRSRRYSRSRSRSLSRGRSRDRSRRSRRSYSRSPSRDRSTRRRHGGRYSGSSGEEDGGYRPRSRQPDSSKPVYTANDPWAHLRNPAIMHDPAEVQRIWQEQMLKSRQLIIQQQAKSAAQAAAKSQRELYIGNLAAGQVTGEALRQVFDSALMAAFLESAQPGQAPVVSVNVHKDGRYAFVEFRSPEYATAALQLNGQVTLMGTTISIGRPAAYVDPNKVAEAAQQAEMAVAMHKAGIVPPLPGPAGVAASAGALAQVFPGGVVSAVPMPVPPAGIPPPAPPPGGPPPPEAAAAAAAVAAAAVGAVPTQNLAAEPGFSVLPTEHVVVGGIVTAAVLEDDDDYLDVVDDLEEECMRHGDVVSVKVPRPDNPADAAAVINTGHYGKAYVQFADQEGARRAKDAIHGRLFAGSLVQAVFITPEAFAAVPSNKTLPDD